MIKQKIKILVAEYEAIVGMEIEYRLRQLGLDVAAIVPTGEKAIQFVEKNAPDLALLSVILRGNLDGVDTALQLKNFKDMPIIFLTSVTDKKSLKRMRDLEPFDIIKIPFEGFELDQAVENAVKFLEEKNSLPLS